MNTAADKRTFAGLASLSANVEQIQAIANAQSRFTDFREATAEQGNGVTSVGSLSPSVIALPAKILQKPPVLIDSVLSKEEFLLLIEHMGNGNPISYFLTVWRDEVGNARYAKAKPHKRADLQASWTWDTIKGRAKRKTSMGLYPKNQSNQSTWAAMDFDAHLGEDDVARDLALKAFSCLREYQDRYVLISNSGRGYHVFIFALEPRPVAEWANVSKATCETIAAPIADGVCELFPNERTERQEVGRAIRVPGSFNPSTGEVELIIAETIRPLIDHLTLKSRNKPAQSSLCKVRSLSLRNLTEIREADNSSSCIRSFWSPSTGRLIEEILAKHPIKAKSTRNGVLVKLVGELAGEGWRNCVNTGCLKTAVVVRQHG